MSEAQMKTKMSRREKDKALDLAAGNLDTDTDISLRETLRILGRGVSYLRFFWGRFALKLSLNLLSLVPPMVLPFIAKLVIDHVILGDPIPGSNFPWFINWFAVFLDGKSAPEMMAWILFFSISTLAVFGTAAGGKGSSDQVEASMAGGYDIATNTENEANTAGSKGGGIIGLMEFSIQLRLSQSLNHLLRSQLFERIKSLPMTKLDDQKIGDSMYRIMYDTPAITNIFFDVIQAPIMIAFIVGNGALVFLGVYPGAPEIIFLAMAMFPIQFLSAGLFSKFLRRKSQASRSAGSVTTGNIEEGMSNVLAVQSLGGNKRELKRFDKNSGESFKRFRVFQFLGGLAGQAMKFSGQGISLFVTFLVMGRVVDGTLTVGDFGVVLFYFGWLTAVGAIPGLWIRLQNNVAGMRRVFFFMDIPTETTRGGIDVPRISEGVVMRGAGLTYPDGRQALKNIDLEGRVGEIVALVGPTGAGKTSLAHLVPAYHLATAGSVLIDGQDIQSLSAESLRKQVSYVFQETHLFSDSIIDNIRYGTPEATREQIESAARVAGAHDFIMSFPEGYDTQLGTVTSKISVGQKQRIAIARGLVKDARILILDEPTSALDPETEAYLVDALHEAAQNKLVIVIAHRLSTIANADRIYFLKDGEILEQGSHEELMAKDGGNYREYVELQGAKS
jgi:ABC-type multidrug transport system fused ATPase/permease subunit